LRLALAEQLVEDDGSESRRPNATKRETGDVEGEVTSAHGEDNCRRYQVAALGEIDAVLDPDAAAGGGNQALEPPILRQD
jgi:hypothetical protein